MRHFHALRSAIHIPSKIGMIHTGISQSREPIDPNGVILQIPIKVKRRKTQKNKIRY